MSQESVMSDENIRQLTKQLPEPISTCIIGGALFEVYKAKDLFNEDWNDPVLYKLLVEARKSYYIFGGGRPLFDEYDAKSAIYLIRAIYPLSVSDSIYDNLVEEWLSCRFVPYYGSPPGAGELDIFIYKGKQIDYWVRRLLFKGDRDFAKHIVASSRMCGINPYFQIGEGKLDSGLKLSRKHRYTALCYALIIEQFLNECVGSGQAFRYFTEIVSDEFAERALIIKADERSLSIAFTPAYQSLDAQRPEDVRLDRYTHNLCAYRFPAYFLNVKQLADLLKRLIREGKLSDSTIQYYLQTDMTFKAMLESGKSLVTLLGGAGNMLTENGRLKDSTITGEELRRIIDTEVDDGPKLKITETKTRTENVQSVLGLARDA